MNQTGFTSPNASSDASEAFGARTRNAEGEVHCECRSLSFVEMVGIFFAGDLAFHPYRILQ